MLSRKNRLTSKYEFNRVRYLANKNNTKYSSKLFHIFYIEARDAEAPTKVGVVISNKFSKSAVVRNRVKRLFREAIRHNFDKIKDGYWIVIHPKFISIDKTYEEINTDIAQVLQKIPISR